jgi:hypothetical protein
MEEEIELGSYAKTPTGRIVKVLRRHLNGRYECSYMDSPGEGVVLEAKHLTKSEMPGQGKDGQTD